MMKPVESSSISDVGYDEKNRETVIQFKNGGRYAYPSSPEDHAQLLGADSIGKHFQGHFRGRACRKL